jgi:hypothetical protein
VIEVAVGKVVRVAFAEEDLAAPGAVPSTGVPVTTTATTTTGSAAPTVDREGETRTWPPAGAWVFGGVGIAGIGVGVGFAVASSSKATDVTHANAAGACAVPSSAACATAQDSKSALDRDRVIQDVGFGVGAAGMVGALIWSAATAGKKASTTALVPDIGPGRGGLTFSSSF